MISNLPLYAQLKETIIEQIEQGTLVPGDQIPSQRKLCEQYQMSHMTVRRAINELMNEGVVTAIPGKGLYVAQRAQYIDRNSLQGFEEQMAHLGVITTTQMLDSGIVSASTPVARTLGVAVGTPLVYMSRLRLADGKPLSITDAYLPHSLCPNLLDYDLAANSLFVTLRAKFNLNLDSSISTVSAILADETQADLLRLALPAPLLFREQVTFLDTGQAIELSRTYLRGDIHHIQMTEGNPPGDHANGAFEIINQNKL